MKAAIIIPARYASTRFPGKMLHEIGGKSLLHWTWLSAVQTGYPVWIAVDDDRIADAARDFGANIVLTGDCNNGTERCALANVEIEADVVVNWQGDSPLINPEWVPAIIAALATNYDCEVATAAMLAFPHPGMVEVECDNHGRAGLFRRREDGDEVALMHIGLYAYWGSSLRRYITMRPNLAEQEQGLEQLRWEQGSIHVMRRHAPHWRYHEMNVPEDSQIMTDMLLRRHGASWQTGR